MAQRDVTHFVADNRFDFVVIHHIHQPLVNAGYSRLPAKALTSFGLVHLIVHRLTVGCCPERGGDFIQTFAVFTAGRRDSRFHPSPDRFCRLGLDLRIAEE